MIRLLVREPVLANNVMHIYHSYTARVNPASGILENDLRVTMVAVPTQDASSSAVDVSLPLVPCLWLRARNTVMTDKISIMLPRTCITQHVKGDVPNENISTMPPASRSIRCRQGQNQQQYLHHTTPHVAAAREMAENQHRPY